MAIACDPRDIYSEELAGQVLTLVAHGKSLRSIELVDGMPCISTIQKWIWKREEFATRYARAKEDAADLLAEEILEISDEITPGVKTRVRNGQVETITYDMVERAKLRVDARKWVAAKLKPKRYGDGMLLKHADANGDQLTFRVEDARQRQAPARVLELPPAEQDD